MNYYVTIYRLKGGTKLGEAVRDRLYSKYNRSIISDETLKLIPAEIEGMMNNMIALNRRMKMMQISVHGMTETNGEFTINPGEDGAIVQISVHGQNKGWTDSTVVRFTAQIIIADHTQQEGGEI